MPQLDDLRERQVRLASDTVLGTGWAPESRFELFVRKLADHLSRVNTHSRQAQMPGTGPGVRLASIEVRAPARLGNAPAARDARDRAHGRPGPAGGPIRWRRDEFDAR